MEYAGQGAVKRGLGRLLHTGCVELRFNAASGPARERRYQVSFWAQLGLSSVSSLIDVVAIE